MWIMTNKFYCSVVKDHFNENNFLVRFRSKKHALEFQKLVNTKVTKNDNADYKYRCSITKSEFMSVMAVCILDINYDNFKDSVNEINYHNILLDIWFILRNYQEEEYAIEERKIKKDYFGEYINRNKEWKAHKTGSSNSLFKSRKKA